MRYGICTGIENAGLVKKLGYDYIELSVTKTMGLDPAAYAAGKKALEESGTEAECFNILFPKTMNFVDGKTTSLDELEIYLEKTVSDMAASEGIKVALEWHKNTVTDTNESGLSFLDEAAADNLYCLWQPTVALNMDERCAGLDMLEARGRLLNLHVYYWLEGKRRPFAEGLDEWRRYLQHVNRNEKRYGLLEFVLDNTEEQFLEDAAQWKRLLQETAMN